MKVKLIETQQGDQMVVLTNGSALDWDTWTKRVRLSVAAIEIAKRERTPQAARIAYVAHEFLKLCGVSDNTEYDDLRTRILPNINKPDNTQMSTCRRCGERIWGRESLLTGYGSHCRRNPSARRIISSNRVAVAQGGAA